MQSVKVRQTSHLLALFFMTLLLVVILYEGGVAEAVAIASLFAYILNPAVSSLEYRGVPRGLASGLVLFAILGSGALAWYLIFPLADEQLKSLQSGNISSQADRLIQSAQNLLNSRFENLGCGKIDLNREVQRLKSAFTAWIPGFLLEGSISLAISLVMIPFLMFFFLKDGSQMKRYFISLVSNRYFEFVMDLLFKMDTQLGNYLRGQFIDALVFGILVTITLWVLGVPYFVIIGIFSGFANLIPFVGPIAGVSLAVVSVVAVQGDINRIVPVVVAFAILKIADDFFVQPLAVGKTVNLHPVAVALGILVAGHFFGIIGMLLIVPFMGFLKVVLEESVQTYQKYRFD